MPFIYVKPKSSVTTRSHPSAAYTQLLQVPARQVPPSASVCLKVTGSPSEKGPFLPQPNSPSGLGHVFLLRFKKANQQALQVTCR